MRHRCSFFVARWRQGAPALRHLLFGTLTSLLFLIVSPAFAAPTEPISKTHTEIPPATDLAADGAWSKTTRKPILLYFERRECPYCVRAQRYLESVAQSRRDRARFRRIEADRTDLPLIDFQGNPTHHAAFARVMKGTLTPTVMVVDGDGKPLAPPLIGLPDESFYSYYLEQLIEDGEAQLQHAANR